jgi:hypothetical protein
MDDDGNPWCPITTDFYCKLGDIQVQYGDGDWPESIEKEFAALDDGLREHLRNCPHCHPIEMSFAEHQSNRARHTRRRCSERYLSSVASPDNLTPI